MFISHIIFFEKKFIRNFKKSLHDVDLFASSTIANFTLLSEYTIILELEF